MFGMGTSMSNGTVKAIELSGFRKNSDIYVAIALIGVLSLMIIPLPSFLLDIFLAALRELMKQKR